VDLLRTYSNRPYEEPRVRRLLKKVQASQGLSHPARSADPAPRRSRKVAEAKHPAIVDGYLAGRSVNELAAEFGINRRTVLGILTKQGVNRRPTGMSEEQVLEAIQRYESSASLATVGRALGFSVNTIRKELLNAGTPMRDRHARRQG